jgi:hypothetical protein
MGRWMDEWMEGWLDGRESIRLWISISSEVVVGLEWGPLSLVSLLRSIEELLD